ncbi:MAG: hypothetical protein HY746_01695 [Elusimicrobia bacterium]|nr:hypothetical protein [Elusimicrobiota bacterium]
MGSVVRSRNWKIDRINRLEIFDGDVSFKNPYYNLKADFAVYDKAKKEWNFQKNIYCLRFFDDGSTMEIKQADSGNYFEESKKAVLLPQEQRLLLLSYASKDGRNNEPPAHPPQFLAETKHGGRQVSGAMSPDRNIATAAPGAEGYADGQTLRTKCGKIEADGIKSEINFMGNFSLENDRIIAASENAFYQNADSSFLLYGSTPSVTGIKEGYDFTIIAEQIKFFRNTGNLSVSGNVRGWIHSVKP